MLRSVELFTGAGGLALGVSRAGFKHEALIEIDPDACETIRQNKARKLPFVRDWPLSEGSVADFPFESIGPELDLLAAGVPCQPWSLGGKHKGYNDHRNLFPDTLKAVRVLKPKAILIENVKGLTRPTFANYFEYIKLMLELPEVQPRRGEDWSEHHGRLQQAKTGREHGLRYNVVAEVLNAADFGVPQRRERVFIVAFRSDLNACWSFPNGRYSRLALLRDQWITGRYWERHGLKKPTLPSHMERRLKDSDIEAGRPWRTLRDAIRGLPDPESQQSNRYPNHQFQPGAKVYPGHTGSRLDEPAKTLKAGDHGVPGGENMIVYPSGRVRYLTIRESARIQTFPGRFVFSGSWTEIMRQLGNAVPVKLAEAVAESIRSALIEAARR